MTQLTQTTKIQRIDTLCDIIESHLLIAIEVKNKTQKPKSTKDVLKEIKVASRSNY